MDVELYIYDLSGGMASQLSLQLTGTFIEAIYHTSVVFGAVEYFYGHGIHRKVPGSTHHGSPVEIMSLGKTDLPREVIDEFIESLSSIYSPEKYDLFHHNCNNFSQDLTAFLVGKDIPIKIRNLPSTFLRTPMGQMMAGMLDQSLRSMTQAPDAVSGRPASQSRAVSKRMARPDPRAGLQLPILAKATFPITYCKVPSPEKLTAKLEPVLEADLVTKLIQYVTTRKMKGADEVALPSLPELPASLQWIRNKLEPQNYFAMIDLLRIAAIDIRFASWLVSDDAYIEAALPSSADWPSLPLHLQVVSLQLACNLSPSPVFRDKIETDGTLQRSISNIVSSCLLASAGIVRTSAATLLYDLATQDRDLPAKHQQGWAQAANLEGVQGALLQAVVDEEENQDVLHALLLALGSLLYSATDDASIWDLCDAMGLETCLNLRSQGSQFRGEPLLKEVRELLKNR